MNDAAKTAAEIALENAFRAARCLKYGTFVTASGSYAAGGFEVELSYHRERETLRIDAFGAMTAEGFMGRQVRDFTFLV